MAKKKPDDKWKPPYDRYVVRFYDGNWDESEALMEGPVSMCGACHVLLDYMREREFIRDNPDVFVSRYRHVPYVSLEVFSG